MCGESNNLEMNDTFSQEFRLTSPGGGFFDYLLGLYYYDSAVERDVTIAGVRSNIAGNVSFPTPASVVVNRATAYVLADMLTKVDTVNKAVFGNLNVRPVDDLTLTAGFRYLLGGRRRSGSRVDSTRLRSLLRHDAVGGLLMEQLERELTTRAGVIAGLVGGIVIWIYEAAVWVARRT